jgi:mono/diheme cytochrome c family protein
MKKTIISISMLGVFLILVSFSGFNLGWDVPAADASIKNPVKADATSIAAGKAEFEKSCKNCHGATGKGVGKMAGISNFTSKEFKSQSDGAIYFKINTGKGIMPKFKTKIKADNDRWNLVNYIRTL